MPLDHAAHASASRAFHARLDNGMEVVVVPDHRAPVVQHMVWYRVGAADEPRGQSGIAHFLEHLMFKGTEKVAAGQFSRIVARNGGQDNAFTGNDATAYYQAVAKDRLPLVMEMEADRMVNLRLDEKDVLTERDVILEERRSRIENDPGALLDEQLKAALYLNHPYGVPVIGWFHEVARLGRAEALAFYRRYYAPNNAILVVAGDVEPEAVMGLARATYGSLPANPDTLRAPRPAEPPQLAGRRLELSDERVGQATLVRHYMAPCYRSAGPLEAEALDLLMKVLAAGATSRLYRRVVAEETLASSLDGYYWGDGLDYGRLAFYGVAADGHTLAEVEAAVDRVIGEMLAGGISQAELDRARNAFIADYVYEADSLGGLARRYGWGLATGQTLEDIEDWPNRLRRVTVADLARVAERHLDKRASVTGWLLPLPAPQGGESKAAA